MTSSARPPAAPAVGGYQLLAKLGEGGMGVVHLARRPGGDRVALKVLRPHIVGDEEARQRLEREVSSLSRVRSRWVAEIVDADPWAEIPYVATRYVPGLSLHDHVVEHGPVTGPDLLWLAAGLAQGIAAVHAVGVLHRDVKPSNVVMEGRTPILIDFGLARVADDPRLTHTGWLLGTPGYLAPEILHGEDATAASDVHSWAATVAYAGTGHPPFGRGPAMAIMDRVRRGQHDLTGLPDRLLPVLTAALDPDPDRRPTLADVESWLRPAAGRSTLPRGAVEEHTVPLAAAVRDAADGLTDRLPEPATDRVPDGAGVAPGAPYTLALPSDEGVDEELDVGLFDGEPRIGPLERLRRGVLLVGLAATVGAGIAAYPWLSAAALLVLVWLLRSGSHAASAVGDRRRLRGRRWYDGVQLLVAAPWHLLRSVLGTAGLALWSGGIALAAALVCYAVAAGEGATLFACGAVLAAALWLGPGGSRVRSPLARLVHPVAASPRRWLVALVVVLAAAATLGLHARGGTDWTPGSGRPYAEIAHPADRGRGSMVDMRHPSPAGQILIG